MLRIKVIKTNNKIKQITFKVHATYDEYGKDIVCDAASATFLCTDNAILSINNKSISLTQTKDTNIIDIIDDDEITIKLIDNMLSCLKSLEQKYPKNIEIK